MGIDLWFRTNISAPRPPILKVKVLNFPSLWGICLNAKMSGFPGQPDEKIRKNRVFWSTYKESCYYTFDNSVVLWNLNGIYSSQMVKRSMWEPFWNGRLNGLIQLVSNKIGRQTFKISENWESENWSKKTSKNWNIKKMVAYKWMKPLKHSWRG